MNPIAWCLVFGVSLFGRSHQRSTDKENKDDAQAQIRELQNRLTALEATVQNHTDDKAWPPCTPTNCPTVGYPKPTSGLKGTPLNFL